VWLLPRSWSIADLRPLRRASRTMSENDVGIPARYRARSLLRECEALVHRLFEANEALIGRRGSAEAAFQPEQIMIKLVDRQQALRLVVDESLFLPILHPEPCDVVALCDVAQLPSLCCPAPVFVLPGVALS
jgi:hypothetical protein